MSLAKKALLTPSLWPGVAAASATSFVGTRYWFQMASASDTEAFQEALPSCRGTAKRLFNPRCISIWEPIGHDFPVREKAVAEPIVATRSRPIAEVVAWKGDLMLM